MSEIGRGGGAAAADGSLLAGALEPGSGAQERHLHQPDNCLNCDTPLVGAYCHACGQLGHVHRTAGAFLHDLLHGALHFEGRFWRTLPMLVLRPGRLTRRYIEGARARFISPMALFLFSVFLMFAVFQVLGISTPTDLSGDDLTRFAGEDAPGPVEETAASTEAVPKGDGGSSGLDINLTGIEAIDQGLVRKWQDNPGLMLYKLQANSYKFSWLLIPLSIPFVWLLFLWRRGFNAYDHAIFVTYSLSFMTFLFIALSLANAAGLDMGWATLGFVTSGMLHIYKQLRGAYSLRRFSALWRTGLLLLFICVIILLFLQVLLLLGAF